MATQRELDNFLKENEKKAFRKVNYQVNNEDDALDIVQEAMIKLVQNYQDKPINEIPLLFNTILYNSTMDLLRRKGFENKTFLNYDNTEVEDADNFEESVQFESGYYDKDMESVFSSKQSLQLIEEALKQLPARQSEAFLLRYWEEMSVEETAEVMKCSEGSVKTHCFRAVQSLKNILKKML